MSNSMKGKGYVKVLNDRSVRGRQGPTTVWSMKVELEDGSESPWITVKFGPAPAFSKGDYIEFEAEQNDKGYWSVNDDGKAAYIVAAPVAKPTVEVSSGSVGSTAAVSSNARQQSIVLQHSQEMAIQAVGLLLANDALPVSAIKTKAGIAKRYVEIRAAINKLTVSFYNDAMTDRLLDSVEDEGVVDVEADGAVPGASSTDQGEDD